MEISIGTGQDTQELWHGNIPLSGLFLSFWAFPVYPFCCTLNKTMHVSMVSCTLAILIKLMEVPFLCKETSLLSLQLHTRIISSNFPASSIANHQLYILCHVLIGKTHSNLFVNCFKTNSQTRYLYRRCNSSLQTWSRGWIYQTLVVYRLKPHFVHSPL